ncbi:hypothetical protein HYW84_03080 [Candidatus Peregrinibacteria bacterium]|nr:hypothetical protein [Candidatus Peregrinibacteria bacterium]
MKHLLAAFSLLSLVACATVSRGPLSMPLQERLRNPLVAERYWSELTEHMADLFRFKDPITKDAVKAAIIDSERLRALDMVAKARTLKSEGISGMFLQPTMNETAIGEVLLRGNILSFGTTFLINPNPSVHVYLTTVVDPRDAKFPDATSLDLGLIQTAFGPQEYGVPAGKENSGFRTAVLYDTMLARLIGFAQLSK